MTAIYTVLLWISLVGGFVPSTWFLLGARPSWPPRSPAYLVSGLVFVIWLLYVRVGLGLVVRGGVPAYRGPLDAAISIGLALGCDALLITLLWTFRRYRARLASENKHDEEAEHGH